MNSRDSHDTAINNDAAAEFLRNGNGVRKFPHAAKRTHVPNRPTPSFFFTLGVKKNGSRSRALCSTSAGVLYTGCSPTQARHAELSCRQLNVFITVLCTLPARTILLPLCHERCICACSRVYVLFQRLAVQPSRRSVGRRKYVHLTEGDRYYSTEERLKLTYRLE